MSNNDIYDPPSAWDSEDKLDRLRETITNLKAKEEHWKAEAQKAFAERDRAKAAAKAAKGIHDIGMPQRRRDILSWCRYFYANDPIIAATIDWYSSSYFWACQIDQGESGLTVNDLLGTTTKRIFVDSVRELLLCGDVFWAKFDDESSIVPPEDVSVFLSPETAEELFILSPSETVKRAAVAATGFGKPIPEFVKKKILTDELLMLYPVCHLKRGGTSYGPYGEPLLGPLLKMLRFRSDLLMASTPRTVERIKAELASTLSEIRLGLNLPPESYDDTAIGAEVAKLKFIHDTKSIRKQLQKVSDFTNGKGVISWKYPEGELWDMTCKAFKDVGKPA